jgi:hypothetical protein
LGGLRGGAAGGGFGALLVDEGNEDFGEGGFVGLLGFGFAGDGGLFEVDEEAEERELAVDEGVDEGVCNGLAACAGSGEDGLGEAAALPGTRACGSGLEVLVVVGGVGSSEGVVDLVGHGSS